MYDREKSQIATARDQINREMDRLQAQFHGQLDDVLKGIAEAEVVTSRPPADPSGADDEEARVLAARGVAVQYAKGRLRDALDSIAQIQVSEVLEGTKRDLSLLVSEVWVTPVASEPTLVISEPAPVISEPTPVISESAPVASESAPGTSESAPGTSEPTPVTNEPVPVASEPTPVASESAPVVSESAPVISEPTPGTSEPTPMTSEPAP